MHYSICIGLLLVAANIEAKSVNLPSIFTLCKRGMPNYSACISKAATEAIIGLAPGLRSFKILPIEPLAVDSVSIGETGGSVSLKQTYKNIKLHGLTKGIQATDYDIDFDKLILRSNSYNPQVDFVGDYRLDGKILLLPIRGHGFSNITLLGLKAKNVIYCEKFNKDGEDYLRVKKYDIKFSPEKVLLRFDNLFDGDAVLGEQMNKFLNENSELLFKELQAPYEETFGLVFASIANNIFSRVPISKLFPE